MSPEKVNQRQWNIWSQQVKSRLGTLVEIGEVRNSPGRMTRYRYLRRHALVIITRGEGHYEDERGHGSLSCPSLAIATGRSAPGDGTRSM